jgi:hypothetical protein
MGPMVRYPMLKSWLSPFRRSQPKTLARVMAAAASVAQASSLAVAGHLAARLGIQRGSALNRLYWLLRNPRVDDQVLMAQLFRLLGAGRRFGTEWHPDLKMRVASGDPGPRSQNGWEPTFLRPRETGRTAAFIGSRGSSFCWNGSRRSSFAGSPRNPRGPALSPRAGGRPPAGQGRPGPRGLGPRVGRTRVARGPVRPAHGSRDTKGCRFGVKFRTPEHLARFTILL